MATLEIIGNSLFLEHDGDGAGWLNHSLSINLCFSTLKTARLVRRGRRGEGLTGSRADNVMLQTGNNACIFVQWLIIIMHSLSTSPSGNHISKEKKAQTQELTTRNFSFFF